MESDYDSDSDFGVPEEPVRTRISFHDLSQVVVSVYYPDDPYDYLDRALEP